MTEAQTRWIRTDASSDLLNSLEHCLLCFTLARSDERNWKWSVAAAHSAAQIAMVMVLVNAQQYEHLTARSRKALLAHFERSRTDAGAQWPDTKLAAFMDLYDACVKRLPEEIATPEHQRDVRRLNSLRNHWTHFGEDGSSVSINLARIAVRAGIKLVVELSPTSSSGLYGNRTDETRHEVAISSLLRLLDAAEADDTVPSTEEGDAEMAAFEAHLAALDDDPGELDERFEEKRPL